MMLLGAEREIENTCAGRLRLAIMIENRLAWARRQRLGDIVDARRGVQLSDLLSNLIGR